MDRIESQGLGRRLKDGMDRHKAILHAMHHHYGTWGEVAKELPFETTASVVRQEVADTRQDYRYGEERRQAIIDYWEDLERDESATLIVLFQCIDRVEGALQSVIERLHEEGPRTRNDDLTETIKRLASQLSRIETQLEGARKIVRKTTDKICDD